MDSIYEEWWLLYNIHYTDKPFNSLKMHESMGSGKASGTLLVWNIAEYMNKQMILLWIERLFTVHCFKSNWKNPRKSDNNESETRSKHWILNQVFLLFFHFSSRVVPSVFFYGSFRHCFSMWLHRSLEFGIKSVIVYMPLFEWNIDSIKPTSCIYKHNSMTYGWKYVLSVLGAM